LSTSIDACHWHARIGAFIPGGDKWWSINEQTIAEQLIQEIKDLLVDKALPEIESYISDEQLRSLWLSGQSRGITEVHRNVFVWLLNFRMHRARASIKQLEYCIR
jgi:hypothetical protein